MSLGISHALVVISKLSLHLIVIQIKILCLHGRSESTDSLTGCTPQARNHIQGKGKRQQTGKEPRNAGAMVHNNLAHLVVLVLIVGEANPTNQISAQQSKQHDPKTQEGFTIEQMPSISQVSHAKEL